MKTATRILVFCVIPLLAISPILILGATAVSNNPPSAHLEWVIDENVGCLDPGFCPSQIGLSTYQITANAFSDHSTFVMIMRTQFSRSGAVTFREIERIHGTWSTTRGPTLSGNGIEFVLTGGTNRTTVFDATREVTTTTDVRNFVTGVPAQEGSYGCSAILGRSCPSDVSAQLSVTRVVGKAPSQPSLDSAFSAGAEDTMSTTGGVAWVVSANLGCFSANFCKGSGIRSEDGTWTLFSNHIAFGVIVGTVYTSTGLVAYRYVEHVTASQWNIGRTTSGSNDFWIVNGVALTTTFRAGHGQQTTSTNLHDVDTGAPATQTTFGCQQLFGSSCPSDVSAFESITSAS